MAFLHSFPELTKLIFKINRHSERNISWQIKKCSSIMKKKKKKKKKKNRYKFDFFLGLIFYIISAKKYLHVNEVLCKQGEVGLIFVFSLFVFRFSFFVFRYSIQTESEDRILTFKILFWHSNWVGKSYLNTILSIKTGFPNSVRWSK